VIAVMGPNVVFRKVDECDLGHLAEIRNDEWMSFHKVRLVGGQDQLDWFDKTRNANDQLHFVAMRLDEAMAERVPYHGARYDAMLAGGDPRFGVFSLTNIDWLSRVATATWGVFKQHRGHGLGKRLVEAGVALGFQLFNLHRMECEILENNKASLAVAAAAGFEREGLKRRCVWKPDGYLDSYVLGILSEDTEAMARCVPVSTLETDADAPGGDEVAKEVVV